MTCKPFQTKSTETGGLDTRVTGARSPATKLAALAIDTELEALASGSLAVAVGLATQLPNWGTGEPLCVFIKCFTKFLMKKLFTTFYKGFYS